MKVPIARVDLNNIEVNSLFKPLNSGWLVQGKEVADFEEKWSNFTGIKHSVAVNSCTSGLQLALVACGFQHGDEAIVPAFTWISTANVVENLGGNVKFCDIDLETFNLEINKLKDHTFKNISAIIPVHLFGLPADLDFIFDLSKKHALKVIEDAACGMGSEVNGKHVGGVGDVGCFSFHPRKSITTGEGGMLTTNDDNVAKRLRMLRDNGAHVSDAQKQLGQRPYLLADHLVNGYNMRMTDLQGALGSAQMERSKEIVDQRRMLAKTYNQAFKDIDFLRTPIEETKNKKNGFQSYPCLFQPFDLNLKNVKKINRLRNEWMDNLNQLGVSTRPATHAVHLLSYYREKYKIKAEDFPNAYIADQCSVSLPLFHGMTSDEQDYVITSVIDVFSKMNLR